MGDTNVYIGDVAAAFDHRLRRVERQIQALQGAVGSLRQEDMEIMAKIDDLDAVVERTVTEGAALRALYDVIKEELRLAGVTDARIDAVMAKLKNEADEDGKRVFANVPPTPEQPPADPNAPATPQP